MSGTNLVYKFDTLEECSRKMGTVINAIDLINDNIKRKKNSITDTVNWRGDTRNAYSERCTTLLEKLDELYKELDKNKKKLDRVISLQKCTENEQFNKVDDLSADNIF